MILFVCCTCEVPGDTGAIEVCYCYYYYIIITVIIIIIIIGLTLITTTTLHKSLRLTNGFASVCDQLTNIR